MTDRTFTIDGIELPRFLYGTAWKEDQTQRLVELAIEHGFRGIDTANQRRHYHEAAVGAAISASIDRGNVVRDDLFLQSKFTFRRGQDHRLPYDPEASIPIQVEQSFAGSLKHLGTERIDSYLLHGPTSAVGLTADDWAAWRAMEAIHDNGPEFISRRVRQFLRKIDAGTSYIEPGSPWQNGYVESFNTRFRDECLTCEEFTTVAEAREVIASWRQTYNHRRPHGSLGGLTPVEFASRCAASATVATVAALPSLQ